MTSKSICFCALLYHVEYFYLYFVSNINVNIAQFVQLAVAVLSFKIVNLFVMAVLLLICSTWNFAVHHSVADFFWDLKVNCMACLCLFITFLLFQNGMGQECLQLSW